MVSFSFKEWLVSEMGAATSLRNPAANKCIIMLGGPGSGKSFASSFFPEFATSQSDKFLQHLMVKASKEGALKGAVEFDPSGKPSRYKADFHNPDIRNLNLRAGDLQQKQLDMYSGALTPYIVEATGAWIDSVVNRKNFAEKMGYDVFGIMVHVPSVETAVQANRGRDREINEKDLIDIHTKLKDPNHMQEVRSVFHPERFFEVTNDRSDKVRQQMQSIRKAILNAKYTNPIGFGRMQRAVQDDETWHKSQGIDNKPIPDHRYAFPLPTVKV